MGDLLGLKASDSGVTALEIAKFVATFGSGNIRTEVEIETQAQRMASVQPVRAQMEEVDAAQAEFERCNDCKAPDEIAPGKAYFEHKRPRSPRSP